MHPLSPVPRSLGAIQEWFQRGVMDDRGSAHEPRRASPEKVIVPSRRLTPRQRLGIYARMYFDRLIECLEQDFPTVLHLVGHEEFHRLARRYLERFPSRHYSLNGLGRNFPRFLNGNVRIAKKNLLHEIARLELAMDQVFDAEASHPLVPADFARVSPQRLASATVRMVPALQVLALRYPANAVVSAVREGRKPPSLAIRKTWVAVYRKDYVVWRLDLSQAAFRALETLAAGKAVAQAVSRAARSWGGDPAGLEIHLQRWFGEWVGEGFFAEFRLPTKGARLE